MELEQQIKVRQIQRQYKDKNVNQISIQIKKVMLKRQQNRIQTQRTIDSPYNQRPYNKLVNYYDMDNNTSINKYISNQKYILLNQYHINHKNNQFQISLQYNQNTLQGNQNTINTSKNKSLPHQQQNSKHFNKFNNRRNNYYNNNNSNNTNNSNHYNYNHSLSQQVINDTNNINRSSQPNIRQTNNARYTNLKYENKKNQPRSLSRKTQKLKKYKTSQYFQQIKDRRILQYNDTIQQISMGNINQNRNNYQNHKTKQPKLNVQVCLQYFNLDTQNKIQKFNKSQYLKTKNQTISSLNKLNVKSLFPKSRKYLEQQMNNQSTVSNQYYSNKLPINAKTLYLSRKYNFQLKNTNSQSRSNKYYQSSPNNLSMGFKRSISRKQNNQSSYVPYFIGSKGGVNQKSRSRKKTQKINYLSNKSQFIKRNNNNSNITNINPDEDYQDCIVVDNVPSNILIQQQNIKRQLQTKQINLKDYGFDVQQFKSIKIQKSTKIFICKYCLQIMNIFEIKYHKGEICNIVHKQKQYVQKIVKLYQFLNQTYQIYYQKRDTYECFKKLAKMIQVKLQYLAEKEKFNKLSIRIKTLFNLKQNYQHKSMKQSDKQKYYISKIQQILHLTQISDMQNVFEAVYKMIDLGKQKLSPQQQIRGHVHLPKIIMVKDLFWLIRKLFEGLVLEKIKLIQTVQQD